MDKITLKTQEEIEKFFNGGFSCKNSFLSIKGLDRWKKQVFNICWDATVKDGFIEILSIPKLDEKAGTFTLVEEKAEIDKTKSRYKVKLSEIEEIVLEIE